MFPFFHFWMAVKDYYMTAQLFQYDNPPNGAGLFLNCGWANDYIENPLTFFWLASFPTPSGPARIQDFGLRMIISMKT